MQVFKGKIFKRVFSVISFVIIFAVSYIFISNQLSSVTYATYFNKELKDICENDEQVEMVFVGSSRLYFSMVPSIFEEKMGYENVLVASTAQQSMKGTYYYTKDLIERVHPQKVIINVTWDGLLEQDVVQNSLLVYDRLSTKNKVLFAMECIEPADRKYILGPCRFRDNILIYDMIKEEKEKIDSMDSNYYDPEEDYYVEKGFVYSYPNFVTGNIPFEYDVKYEFSEDNIIEENVMYLDKCIELCQENDIEVSLVSMTTSLPYVYLVEGYDDAVEWYKEYANSKGISYYNFNYLRNRENILPDEMMFDLTHINGEGAQVISNLFADILIQAENGEDVSVYFYDSFTELKQEVHRIAAVSANISFSAESIDSKIKANVSLKSIQNGDVTPLYQVEMIEADGNIKVLVEWTYKTEMEIFIPQNGNYSIKVRAKTGIDGEAEAFQIYYY